MKRRNLLSVALMGFAAACVHRVHPVASPAAARVRCLKTTPYVRNPIATGQGFATAAMQRRFHLAAFDSADVRLVTDDALCRSVSVLLGPLSRRSVGSTDSSFSDVVVVTLGRAGYLVAAEKITPSAGEFFCEYALVDPHLKTVAWNCG